MAVIEGKAAPTEQQALADHLARCGRCAATYGDLLELQLATVADASVSEPSRDWVDLGLQVTQPPVRLVPPRRARRHLRVAATAAAVLVVAAGTVLVVQRSRTDRPVIEDDFRKALEPTLRVSTPGGLLYAPWLLPEAAGVRGSPSNAASAALQEMARRHSATERSEEIDFWWIAGSLAAGEDRNAQVFLDEALAHYAHKARFLNLAAILEVKRGDLAAAEKYLRVAAAQGRSEWSECSEFNLALVLRGQGREAEARQLLEHVRSSRRSPLAAHAGAVLASGDDVIAPR